MERNVGGVDRTLRIILGIAIIGAGVYYESWWGALGLLPLVSGLACKCTIYSLLNISTRKN